jgi:hypothetical protein
MRPTAFPPPPAARVGFTVGQLAPPLAEAVGDVGAERADDPRLLALAYPQGRSPAGEPAARPVDRSRWVRPAEAGVAGLVLSAALWAFVGFAVKVPGGGIRPIAAPPNADVVVGGDEHRCGHAGPPAARRHGLGRRGNARHPQDRGRNPDRAREMEGRPRRALQC